MGFAFHVACVEWPLKALSVLLCLLASTIFYGFPSALLSTLLSAR